MPSNGLCFVCQKAIIANDASMRSIEFVGDAHFEPGRYAAHGECSIGLRHHWLTRGLHGQLVPLAVQEHHKPVPWYLKIVTRFFAWGATKFQAPRRFE